MNQLKHTTEFRAMLANYKPSSETVELVRNTPILLLVGVSGAGKDTIKQRLLVISDYHEIVSHTTRAPRVNGGVMERGGVEYHFIDPETAKEMLAEHAFVEAKMYSGSVYGTSAAEIRRAHDEGKIALADIEVQGVAEYKALAPGVRAVFVLPPSYEAWQTRLRGRHDGKLNPDDFIRRMETARKELECALATGYFHFVVNEGLERAVAEVDAIAKSEQPNAANQTRARQLAEQLYRDVRAHANRRD